MSIIAPSHAYNARRRSGVRLFPAGVHERSTANAAVQRRVVAEQDNAAWPAALNWQQALEYSGLAVSFLRKLISEGRLVARPIGPNGRKVVLRAELDRILSENLRAEMKGTGIEEDFDFG